MEAALLVSRNRDPTHERHLLVTLTDAGRRLKDTARNAAQTMSATLRPEGIDHLRESVRVPVAILALPVESGRPRDARLPS